MMIMIYELMDLVLTISCEVHLGGERGNRCFRWLQSVHASDNTTMEDHNYKLRGFTDTNIGSSNGDRIIKENTDKAALLSSFAFALWA